MTEIYTAASPRRIIEGMTDDPRRERPGERLSRRFWTLALIVVAIAGLDAISHTVAVAAVTTGALLLIGRAVTRPTRRR